jgi:hypothetical protein
MIKLLIASMKTKLTFLLLILFASSCDKEGMPFKEFIVIVEATADVSCGLPVIRFLGKEAEVRQRTNLEALTYNAYSLDNSLNTAGILLYIEFTELSDQDFRACNTLGITYPGIKITSARPVD